jgi:hypothetical protein
MTFRAANLDVDLSNELRLVACQTKPFAQLFGKTRFRLTVRSELWHLLERCWNVAKVRLDGVVDQRFKAQYRALFRRQSQARRMDVHDELDK